MSKAVVDRLTAELGERILETSDFRGDDEVRVAPKDWLELARLLKEDAELQMDHFGDLTAVDYIEREPEEPRFDVVLHMRSSQKGHRIRVKTRIAEGEKLASLTGVWAGADWAEREVWDMFGIPFEGHPDLRRILMYPEFEGYPLRKDYPIDRVQPLVPYRDVPGVRKMAPFGIEEGQPFARIDWEARLAGGNKQVSPAIALQQGQRRNLSDSEIAEELAHRIAEQQGATESESGDASADSGE